MGQGPQPILARISFAGAKLGNDYAESSTNKKRGNPNERPRCKQTGTPRGICGGASAGKLI